MKQIKKIMAAVLGCLLLVAVWPSAQKAQAAIPAFEEAVIVSDGVNMRLRPTVDSPFVLKLINGTRVGVFSEEVEGWYRIIYGNYRGYVSKEFVFLPSTDVLVGNITEDSTPVYQNAGDFSKQTDQLNAGEPVTVLSMQREHYYVEYAHGAEGLKQDTATQAAKETEEVGLAKTVEPSEVADVQADAPSKAEEGQTDEADELAPDSEIQLVPDDAKKAADSKRGYILKEAVKTSTAKNAMGMVYEGMNGVEVLKLQRELQKRGFLGDDPSGEFGAQTKQAVSMFQEMAELGVDGIAGLETLELLYDDQNDIRCSYAQRMGLNDEIQLVPWDEVDKKYIPKDTVYTVMDVRTGISWQEYRFGGWYHSDTVPLTKEDTEKMKQAVGGWTWERRPIWVLADGVNIAASMNSMPHLSNAIPENNFGGHHCIHFYQSKVHETSQECPRHAAQVQYAYKMGQEN